MGGGGTSACGKRHWQPNLAATPTGGMRGVRELLTCLTRADRGLICLLLNRDHRVVVWLFCNVREAHIDELMPMV